MSEYPIWAYSTWWFEFPPEHAEYRRRLSDFLHLQGVPCIVIKRGEIVAVELATLDCEEEVNFGHPQAPDDQIVCKWCGQKKTEFQEFMLAIARDEKPRPTKTAGLIRTIEPRYRKNGGYVDTEWGDNWVWTKCPHIRAWKEAGTFVRRSKGRFIEASVPPEVKKLTRGIGRI